MNSTHKITLANPMVVETGRQIEQIQLVDVLA
jgi:hypothetical protein